MDETTRTSRRDGWWWKFVALISGAPPVAVWAAQDEVEAEREAERDDPSPGR